MAEPSSSPVELDARVEGDGEPILLLHGLGGDRTVWNGLIRPLSEDYRVLAPDLRGHGKTPFPEGTTMGFSEHEADLARLLDQHGQTSANVVGLSAGGFLGLRWAFDHPERVRSLVLIGAASHCDAHTRAVADRWAETLRTDGFDAYLLRLLKDLFSPDWMEAHMEFADRLRQDLQGRDLKAAELWGRAVRSFDVRARLGTLRLPTLVMQGMDDAVIDA
ncbi:MAG: alpha/beta hydrolase, partial [Thermoplasmata archaeon]|nr:alpha/beta hydrolase [Thermoplasmata archaeon]